MTLRRKRPKQSARSYALWLLGRQAYTSSRLSQRLLKRGYSHEEMTDAVSYLQEIGYLDDKAYAARFVANRARAGNGPRKLRWQLLARGVDTDIIDENIARVDTETWQEQAMALGEKWLRGRSLQDGKVRSGLGRYLMQRGYDFQLIEEVMQKLSASLDREGQNS